ncbi:MAG: DUF3386 family protein, partial [Alkalinema sp. RL_2_19]|nr:DUF3386 family protein [Alkalinema sp. RL_2_19]
PQVRREDWSVNPIDRFVLARLETEGLEPAPEAEKVKLLRRLSLDLVGLPPTLPEVSAFLHDTGEGCLSHTYDSVYQDAKTGESVGGKQEFTDTYETVGNYQILNRREIKTEGGTMEFIFSNIALLK